MCKLTTVRNTPISTPQRHVQWQNKVVPNTNAKKLE